MLILKKLGEIEVVGESMQGVEKVGGSEVGVGTDKTMKCPVKKFLLSLPNSKWLILDGHWNARTVNSTTKQRLIGMENVEACLKGNISISDR